MGVVQKLDSSNRWVPASAGEEGKHHTAQRVYPIDKYEIPDKLLAIATDYRLLKVPLLGQAKWKHDAPPKFQNNWCGRTSATMLYNWFELVEGTDPKERYITFWNNGDGRYMELRFPDGDRAFHQTKDKDQGPKDRNVDGYAVGGMIGEIIEPKLGYTTAFLFDKGQSAARMAKAATIANDRAETKERCKHLVQAIDTGNPVLFYTGFSVSFGGHLILMIGYFMIPDSDGKDALWLAFADPSTIGSKIIGPGQKKDDGEGVKAGKRPFFKTPSHGGDDMAALDKLSDDDNLLQVIRGDWDARRAGIWVVKAKLFFEPNPNGDNRLCMDDLLNTDSIGGKHIISTILRNVPPEAVVQPGAVQSAYPMSHPDDPGTPVAYYDANERGEGGYYPLGLYQNVHSGVHLPSAMGLGQKTPHAPVRCIAPGHVVAARLTGAIPDTLFDAKLNLEEAKKRAARANEIAGTVNGMVLVRHVMEVLPKKPPEVKGGTNAAAKADPNLSQAERKPEPVEKPKDVITFYSLYLHVRMPDAAGAAGAAHLEKVGWLNEYLRRYKGSLTVIDPDHPAFGSVFHLAAEPTPKGALLTNATAVPFSNSAGATETPITLGNDDTQRICAIYKEPGKDITDSMQALQAGEVLTFANPTAQMLVNPGDVLGYAPANTKIAPGFFHFEVLSPGGAKDGLVKLRDIAIERLELGGSAFEEFEESTANNYFDAEGKEIAGLLDKLPKDDDPNRRRYLPVAKDQELSIAEVRGLMQMGKTSDDEKMAFSTGWKGDANRSQWCYQATLLLEPLKKAVPPKTYTVAIQFCGKGVPDSQLEAWPKLTIPIEIAYPLKDEPYVKIPLIVPGWATHLQVDCDGFGLEQGELQVTQQEAGEHFKRIAGARWRNLMLKGHLNEWSEKPLMDVLRARFEENTKDEDLAAFAKVIAWWGHEEAQGRSDAPAKQLFGDDLPMADTLDHMHPITATWLAALLTTSHPKPAAAEKQPGESWSDGPHARFVQRLEELAAVKDITPPEVKPQYVGWAPVTTRERAPITVGDPVTAVVVSDKPPDYGADTEVIVEATGEGHTFEVGRGTLANGIYTCHANAEFWGSYAVKAADAKQLGTDITVHQPVPEPVVREPVAQRGRNVEPFSWSVDFSEHCPSQLRGYVTMWVAKKRFGEAPEPEDFEEQKVGIPVLATRARVVGAVGEERVHGFYVQGPWSQRIALTDNFTWKNYRDAAGKTPVKLAVDLTEAVQEKRNELGGPSDLRNLRDDGCYVQIRRRGETTWHEVKVSAPSQPEQNTSGSLSFEFDPDMGYDRMLAELAPSPEEIVHVVFGYRFFNGGHVVKHHVEPDEPFTPVLQDWAALEKHACISGRAQQICATLTRPSFGKVKIGISGNGLIVTVPLIGGDRAMWRASVPLIDVNGHQCGEIIKRTGVPEGEPQFAVTRTINMGHTAYRTKELTIKAVVGKKENVIFNGAQVQIGDSKEVQFNTTPEIKKIEHAFIGDVADDALPDEVKEMQHTLLELIAETRAIPSNVSLRVAIASPTKTPADFGKIQVVYFPPDPDFTRSKHIAGLCNFSEPEGGEEPKQQFKAHIVLSQLADALQAVDEGVPYTVTIERDGSAINGVEKLASPPLSLVFEPAGKDEEGATGEPSEEQ